MEDDNSWATAALKARAVDEALKPQNRAALFDALVGLGVTAVAVEFDGGGDEGQIEAITFYRNEDKLPEPDVQVEFRKLAPAGETEAVDLSLADAVETVTYDLLEQAHMGWENGEGGYGDFRFEVGPRTVALSLNARFVDSQNYQYSF